MNEELIARLEAASEGSRELDGDIAEALSLYPLGANRTTQGMSHYRAAFATSAAHVWISPRYTTSVDCALTLCPESGYIRLERYSDGWYATIKPASYATEHSMSLGQQKPAALALCISALKARAAIGGSDV